MTSYACPCCGCLTYSEPPDGGYEICPVCFWEDDPIQFADPSFEGGANRPSLNQAREYYKQIGACDPRDKEYVRPSTKDELPSSSRND